MCAARVRRLPGFRFETQAPPLPEVLPRMDIAVFVGFAASGPLQIPVAIESVAQFTAIFGDDAPIAWDLARGEQLYAYLGPAVRAFFRNKGQRCWVVRVARQEATADDPLNHARYNYFPIPALARVQFENSGSATIMPAFARARAEGSWSDRVQVSSALLATPFVATGPLKQVNQHYSIQIEREANGSPAPGDLLRLDFVNNQFVFLAVAECANIDSSPPSSTRLAEVTGTKAVWFEELTEADIPTSPTPVNVHFFTAETNASTEELSDSWFGNPRQALLISNQKPGESFDGRVIVELTDNTADAPLPGSIVQIEQGTQRWWMNVEMLTSAAGAHGAPVLISTPVRAIDPPGSLPTDVPNCQLLKLEIWTRKDDEFSVSLSELGFEAAHERFWGSLPTDEELYRPSDAGDPQALPPVPWSETSDLFRFPLAGIPAKESTTEMFFPLAMPLLPENYLGPVNLNASALQRDGLAKFDENLFLDGELIETQTADLAGEAEYLMYLAPAPRLLKGIHAAFPLEEVTLLAVPDAVHRNWTGIEADALLQPEASAPPVRPQWWHFLDCNAPKPEEPELSDCEPQPPPAGPIKGVPEPEWGNFLDCSIKLIDAPVLSSSTSISEEGTFTLSWNAPEAIDGRFELQEGSADFEEAETIYSGRANSFTLYGRKSGDYFYRVRKFVGAQFSDWSNGIGIRVGEAIRWVIEDSNEASATDEFLADVLLAVQRSALRMCAARGDLVCLLSLPAHYREDAAIAHVELLKSGVRSLSSLVSPLTSGELNDLTYGALFHPWLIEREENEDDRLTRMPPCGAVAGLFADRALSRGAWIAPANQPMRGVVSLEPPINRSRWFDLQEARINLVRQEPRGFLVLDAETLSDDPELIQMNVRRLLILLRRQALRLGARYVFEPNSPAFRRAVDRGFTQMLDGMFERGAFAGATPASAYQVVVDNALNTPQSVDQGRFIVELKVAPSLPMTFLTIRLVQTSERSLALEVR